MAEVRVTHAGAYVEEGGSSVRITHAGAYIETEPTPPATDSPTPVHVIGHGRGRPQGQRRAFRIGPQE